MIKLIATDIDGTLVKDGTLLIDPEYMSVIDQLIDRNIIFVVCSGRQFSSERKQFAPWFLGKQFNDAGILMMIEAPVILFIGWSNVTGTQYLMPINRTKEYTVSVTVGAVINVIANLFLIALWGARGATLATDISEFAVAAVQLVYIRQTISRRKLFGQMWKYLLSGGIMFIITYRLAMIMNMTIPNLAIEVIIGAVIYIIGIFILRAPVINQAIALINSRKAKRE